MPAAIRMANGYTYYPGGFNHAVNMKKSSNPTNKMIERSPEESEYMRRLNTYGKYWADKGEDPVPNPDSGSSIKWVSKDTAYKMQRAMDKGEFNYAGTGLRADARDFVRNTGKKISLEGRRISVGYKEGQRQYNKKHGENGNAFGRTMAGVGGAVKNTTAYRVGKAAVSKAGEMLSKGAGWVGDKAVKGYNKIKETAFGKGVGTVAGAVAGAGRKVGGAVVGAGKKVGGAVVGAGKAVGGGFVSAAKAIYNSPVGKAARTAGKAALSAGSAVVGAVGTALGKIRDFFGNAYTNIRDKFTKGRNKGKSNGSSTAPKGSVSA